MTNRISYDVWGNISNESVPGALGKFGYAGYQIDTVTGLDHSGARDYDPVAHFWVQQDPTGLLGPLTLTTVSTVMGASA